MDCVTLGQSGARGRGWDTRLVPVYDVIVIGAGFAGVTAARELSAEGRDVLLLEARDRLGGRTWYQRSALGDRDLELGGNWIDPAQRLVTHEVGRYGIGVTDPLPFSLPTSWLVGGRLITDGSPVPLEEMPGLERLLYTIVTEARRIDPERALTEQGLEDLDVGFDDFLDRFELGACTRELASVFLSSEAGLHAKHASTLHWLRLVAVSGGLLRFLAVNNQSFRHGTISLLEAMLSDTDVDVQLSSPVRRIEQRPDRVRVLSGNGDFETRTVIVTIPSGVLAQVEFEPPLSDAKRTAAQESHAGAGTKVWAVVRGAPDDFFAVGRAPGLDVAWTEWPEEDGNIVVGFGPDSEALDPTDRQAVERAFRAYLPDAEVLASTGHNWTTDPLALGTWPSFRAGQITRDETALARREGRIAFAGAETARRWPSYIEGAIESGFRAAAEASELLETGAETGVR
jgi:monoamine oxidase